MVTADGSTPVRRARITVIAGGRSADPAFTDADGLFEVVAPRSARYTLRVTKAGFVALDLAIAAVSDALVDVRLVRGAVVSGRVLGQNGEPVVAGQVGVSRIADAPATTSPSLVAETDDLGDFRVAGLPSGRYKVTYSGGRVAVTGGSVSPFAPAPEEQIVEARSGDETFVSLTDRTAARLVSAPKLVVTPAALTAVIDSARVEGISLNTTTASSSAPATQGGVIRGRVTGPDGQAVAGAMVRLMSSAMVSRTSSTVGAAAAVAFSEKFATTDAQGRYELRNVADGGYVLLVSKAGLAQAKDIDAPATDTWRGTELSIRAREQQNRVDLVLVKGGIVSGRVMDSTGRPVVGASVRSETGGSGGSPVSDAEGRYELRDLPAGALSIVVSRPLTASGSFDGNETMQRRTIVLGEGQRLDGVDLVVPKGGVISGRILDELGEPVEGLSVRALQAQTVGGRTLARPVGRVAMRKTDDRGQYRIYGLPPGTFYIVATDRTTAATGSGVDLETSPRVYYPDRPSMTDALTVQIDGVSDAAGGDMTFAPARGAQIVGVALHSSGQAVTGAAILLTTGRPGVAIPEPLGSTIGPAGEFEFRHVPPGDYIVQIIGRRLWGVSEEFAAQAVSVRGTESLPLVITTSSPSTLLGRIQLEGAATSLSPSSFTLRALPADPDLHPRASRRAGPRTAIGHTRRLDVRDYEPHRSVAHLRRASGRLVAEVGHHRRDQRGRRPVYLRHQGAHPHGCRSGVLEWCGLGDRPRGRRPRSGCRRRLGDGIPHRYVPHLSRLAVSEARALRPGWPLQRAQSSTRRLLGGGGERRGRRWPER